MMASQVAWCVEGRVLYVQFADLVNSDSVNMLLRFIAHEIDRLTNPLRFRTHVVFNTELAKNQQPNVVPLTQSINEYFTRPQLGWTILVSTNRLHRTISHMAAQLTNARWKAFSSDAEAMQFLNDVDKTLPDLPQQFIITQPLAMFE